MRYNLNIASYDTARIFVMFDALSETERKVLALRFGLDGQTRTLGAVADLINSTRGQVRVIEARAIQTLITGGLLDEMEQ